MNEPVRIVKMFRNTTRSTVEVGQAVMEDGHGGLTAIKTPRRHWSDGLVRRPFAPGLDILIIEGSTDGACKPAKKLER